MYYLTLWAGNAVVLATLIGLWCFFQFSGFQFSLGCVFGCLLWHIALALEGKRPLRSAWFTSQGGD